jgi:levanase/fructan beta-fructosidase
MFAIKVLAQQAPTPQWRPAYHFTPPSGWTNDPNGLIFLDGKYNLYYQHNPFENKWGHMSWGHATSTDLLHWKNLPVAIPEIVTKDTLTYIYSGSAVVDKNNTSGFGKNGKAPIVAIFTADQPKQKKESQYIAYSNDGGKSYTQYVGNPVIDLNKKDFRDPNVFWHEPTKQWIMTVAMVDEHMVRIYGSKNLKEWTRLSDFGPAGYTKSGWECPSMVPLLVDGNKSKIKWVLFVSAFTDRGPSMQYFIGDFDGTTFKNSYPGAATLPVDGGDAFYAAIPWRLPNHKTTLLGWLVPGKPDTYPWRGQMSIPRDLSLKTTSQGLRLLQQPTVDSEKKLDTMAASVIFKDIQMKKSDVQLPEVGNCNAYWIDAEFVMSTTKLAGFKIAQNKDMPDNDIIVGYDAAKQQLFIDCSNAEKNNKSAVNHIQTIPMRPMKLLNTLVKIQLLVDRNSIEVFGNNGERAITTAIYPDTTSTGVSIFGEYVDVSLKIRRMDK